MAASELPPPASPPAVPAEPSLTTVAVRGLCPRCGAPGLFAGITRFAQSCSVCALDFSSFNVGDGPAAFLTLIVGTLITALAVWLELAVHPPFWVHVVLWVPITVAAVLGGLRVTKAALLCAEYRRRAGEGRRSDPS